MTWRLLVGGTWREKELRILHLTNKRSLSHWDEQHAVNEFAETGFYNPLHGCQTQSGLIRGNVWLHYRPHRSALISSKVDSVWERSEGTGPPCRRTNLSSIYWNDHNLKYVLLSQGVFIIRPRPSPCRITSVITSPLCSYYKINAETFLYLARLNGSIIFYCRVCMTCTFPKCDC